MPTPELSVIIPTYNRADVLRRTLTLLALQTLRARDFEVIVVDDGSTDGTARVIEEFQKNGVIHVIGLRQENSGQGIARNRGIDAARGRILIFIGDDMLPTPDFVSEHFRFHVLHPETESVAVGFVRWHEELPVTRFMRWLETSGVPFKFNDLVRDGPVDFFRFYTANVSVKREFLRDTRFDSDFKGWGWEDAELGLRLAKAGMRLTFWPDAAVSHLHPMTDIDLEKRQYSSGKNAVLFQSKHPDVAIIPTGVKLFAQYIVAYALPFTFWSRAKRAFLRGVREAEGEK